MIVIITIIIVQDIVKQHVHINQPRRLAKQCVTFNFCEIHTKNREETRARV